MRQPSHWGVAAMFAAGIASSTVLLYSWRHLKRKKHRTGDEAPRKGAGEFKIKTLLPPHLQRDLYKEQRRQERLPELIRKTPMYDNINMLDPQGELLATVSRKKARWYVKKHLARWSEPDSSIRLNFSPRAHSGDEYCKTRKSNVCVSCGSDGVHIRHYVVPYAYRSLLPIEYKTHLSHDVVILCPDCHLHCEYETQLRMKLLEQDCPDQCRNSHYVNAHLHQVRSAALALVRWRDKIPAHTQREYDRLVRTHLNDVLDDELLSADKLQEATNVEYRMANPNHIAGPEWVVRSLSCDAVKIKHFIQQWRQHFVTTVQPNFLPHGWSVDAPVTSNVQETANVNR